IDALFFVTRDTAGVDDDAVAFVVTGFAIETIAREAGVVRHQRVAAVSQPIEERGFAHVGTADKGQYGSHASSSRNDSGVSKAVGLRSKAGAASLHAIGGQGTTVAVDVEDVALRQHVGAHALAVYLGARHEAAIGLRQQVHVTFGVADSHVVTEAQRRGQSAALHLIVGPARTFLTETVGFDDVAFAHHVNVTEAEGSA